MRLVGYLGMFRKSQEVWACNFDPKGVNASRKPNPGTLFPPPRVIGLKLAVWLIFLMAPTLLFKHLRRESSLSRMCSLHPISWCTCASNSLSTMDGVMMAVGVWMVMVEVSLTDILFAPISSYFIVEASYFIEIRERHQRENFI